MATRYRKITKVGKGRYVTSSWKISDILWIAILYYICVFPFVFMIKYCIVLPIKWIIKKIKEHNENNNLQ